MGRYKLKLQQWASLQPLYDSVGEWWESIKTRTPVFFSLEGTKRAKTSRQWLLRKQGKLQRYYNLLNLGFDVSEEIMNLKKEMMVVLNEKSKGVLIRSRVKHMEENENCTRYFFRKLYKSKPVMDCLINGGGKEVESTQEILEATHSFYANLYKEQSIDEVIVESFISKLTQRLDSDDRTVLDEDIMLDEIRRAMISMQDNKTPGLDGLPKEYYQAFWEQLSPSLCSVYKEVWDKGVWSVSMNTGVISLLWKKGSKKDLRNWRPLTLLGVDIKILAKALFFFFPVAGSSA